MSWNTHYLPPDPMQWHGRTDIPAASTFYQIIQMLNLLDGRAIEVNQQTFALVGFRCDEGIRRNHGRIGAAEGPKAIRQALAKLPIQRQNFACFDAGDIVCHGGNLEEAQHALADLVSILLQHRIVPIIMGGGHELAWGHYQGIAQTFQKESLGIVNFDAHFDMRPLLPEKKGSSGTPFLQIAEAHRIAKRRFDYNCLGIQHAGNIRLILDTAKMFNVKIIWADEVHQGQQDKCVDFVDRVIDENQMIYMSLCLDVFAAAFAPGVSAIQPLGLWPWHIIPLIRQLAASGKVISYDIAELSPRYDIDQRTAKLAANFIYEIIHHHDHTTPMW